MLKNHLHTHGHTHGHTHVHQGHHLEAHHLGKLLTSIHEHKGKHEKKIEKAQGFFKRIQAHQKELKHYDENHKKTDEVLKKNIENIQERLREARQANDKKGVETLEKNLGQKICGNIWYYKRQMK